MIARLRDTRGQGLVEFTIVLPVALLLLVAIVDVGRVIWANDTVAAAAAAAARYASVHGGSPGQACPAGPANETVAIPQASAACPYPSPSKQAIVDAALARAATAAGTVTVQVCYFREEDTPCSGNTDSTTNAPGALVRVTVRAQLGLVVTALLGNQTFSVAGTATMVINY